MKKILLLCSAGMSTSILVNKMRIASTEKGIESVIDAVGLERFSENLDKYDVFLLGPQVRFKKNELQEIAEKVGKKVEVINTLDYGMMKGDKVLEYAISLINN